MSSRFFNGELAPLRLLTQFYASFHFEHRAVQGLGRAIMNTKVTSFKSILAEHDAFRQNLMVLYDKSFH